MWKQPPEGKPREINDDNFVSIIWTHYAMNDVRSEMARASLETLIETTKNVPCEIIVVDNGNNLRDSKHFLELAHKNKIQHYIRNAENLHFSYARNQGILLAQGEYVAIVDNDILFDHKWLQLCIGMLEQFPDKKFIASIIYYPYTSATLDKRYHAGTIQGKYEYKLNQRAGSNCMVMKKKVFEEIGVFPLHHIGGSHFTDNLVRGGYVTILPPEKFRYMAKDCGLRRGYNLKQGFTFVKTLTDGSKKYYDKNYFINLYKCLRPTQNNPSTCEGDNEVVASS